MREIKFRYKWKGNFYYIDLYNSSTEIKFSDYEFRNKTTPFEQYIGLKDKNGFEIYEGDVLKCVTRSKNEHFIGVVSMPKSCWVVGEEQDNGFIKYRRTANFKELEVIGNIHENT